MLQRRILVGEEHQLTGLAVAAALRSAQGVAEATVVHTADEVAEGSRAGADLLLVGIPAGGAAWGLGLVEDLEPLQLPLRVLLVQEQVDLPTLGRAFSLLLDGDGLPEGGTAVVHGRHVGPAAADVVDVRTAREQQSDDERLLARLTGRERQVLALLVQGVGTSGIALALHVAQSTARTHLHRVMRKLGVHSQLQAAAAGRRLLGPADARADERVLR